MKKILFVVLMAAPLLFSSCHEDLKERAAREAREFTEKNCPQRFENGLVMDSMVFDIPTTTLHYYYTISGQADEKEVLVGHEKELRQRYLEAIRKDISSRMYKENGFFFAMQIRSKKNPDVVYFKTTFTPKDYK